MTKVFSELCEAARGVLSKHVMDVEEILSGADDPALKNVLQNQIRMTGGHIEDLRGCMIEDIPG